MCVCVCVCKRNAAVAKEMVCGVCGRKFSREGDKKRHKCREERRKDVRVCVCVNSLGCDVCRKKFCVHFLLGFLFALFNTNLA